jgi:hypothetical protein
MIETPQLSLVVAVYNNAKMLQFIFADDGFIKFLSNLAIQYHVWHPLTKVSN